MSVFVVEKITSILLNVTFQSVTNYQFIRCRSNTKIQANMSSNTMNPLPSSTDKIYRQSISEETMIPNNKDQTGR